jgi:uncharacterized cofD-like protein
MPTVKNKKLKVVTIGGGTGSFTLLDTFKDYFARLTAIVNMADDGGSTGVLRDELGVLPPGDIRQCLVALSQAPEIRDLFNYRFREGSLKGQSFGNLFISASEKISPDFESAITLASHVLRINGKVLPVATENAKLVLRWPDGRSDEIRGQNNIRQMHFEGKTKPQISHEPTMHITKASAAAIAQADCVVIGPGDLYASLAPALTVDGMMQALSETDAVIIYACNLVNRPGQTDNFRVHDYAVEIERFIGAPVLDYVLYNTDRPEPEILDKYIHAGELLVELQDWKLEDAHYQAIGLPLIAHDFVRPNSAGDALAATRSFIRHDASLVAATILELVA